MRSLPVASAGPARPEPNDVDFAPLGERPNVLLVWPSFPTSFWGFEGMLQMLPERSLIPPLGLLTVAALCPPNWRLRLVDEGVETLVEADLAAADLVLVSAMHAQRERLFALLAWARRLGVRTMVGGPFASTQPDVLLERADHVVVGEVDATFHEIAGDLERGHAKRLYVVDEKPDPSVTPVPRFDLLALKKYSCMPVQFSRGCPFQCEFCDIITIYGRRPRTKATDRLVAELEALRRLGWQGMVFVVDDNFIGNHKRALELARAIIAWQAEHKQPFSFFTEASIDLAERPDLIDAMVAANFMMVFIGIESPSPEALKETKKFQNLRRDVYESVLILQRRGLWVIGGFIVGFDSDTEAIFELQQSLIERTAIAWAMAGFLQAPPSTPLFDRMERDGRLLTQTAATVTSNFSMPNFRTIMPRKAIVGGVSKMLQTLYHPAAFYRRAARSLSHWRVRKVQRAPKVAVRYQLAALLRSIWRQGIISRYRGAYWRFVAEIIYRWHRQPEKIWWGFTLLFSGEHFIKYAAKVVAELEATPADQLEG